MKAYSYIRFSTPDQLKGDSLRRQTEASKAYAAAHGLEYADPIADLGISGFRGTNATEGALRAFLQKVEEGRVEPGSVLIIESLDRLSRQEILKSLTLFTSILGGGVKIVTLSDNQEYPADSINNIGNLVISLVVMARAHEESAIKSKRLSAAWQQKRRNAQMKPLTAATPAWLRLNNETNTIEIIEARATIVREIFEKTIEGVGKRVLARQLNERGETPWGRSKGWHSSYITKILDNRAVLGEYQPHTGRGKDRKPVGEPVLDYYPAIIDENIFYAAKGARGTRLKGGGRKGESFSNLLTGLCYCKDCNDTMRYVDKGQSPKGGRYLTCSNNMRAIGCENNTHYRYFEIESWALYCLYAHGWADIENTKTDNQASLRTQLQAEEEKEKNILRSIQRYQLLFETADDDEFLDAQARYKELMIEREQIKANIDKIKQGLANASDQDESFQRLMKAFDLLENAEGGELYGVRASINQQLKYIVERFEFSKKKMETEYVSFKLAEGGREVFSYEKFRKMFMRERDYSNQARDENGRYIKAE